MPLPVLDQSRPAARSRWGLTAGLICAVVVVMAAVLLLQAWPAGVPTPTPTQSTAPTGAAPTDTAPIGTPPTGTPGTGSGGTHTGLAPQSSRLYNVGYARSSGSCPTRPERPPLPDAELVAYLQKLADCLTDLNRDSLAAQGIPLTGPTVKGFRVQADTGCGVISRYAFYCPEDRTIYVDLRSDDDWRFYGGMRLGYFAVISHEYGHHLQLVGGITRGYADADVEAGPDQRLELSRRVELQATCFSGVAYGVMGSSIGLTDRDLDQIRDYFDRNNDEVTREGTHGNARTMRAWFQRGMGERSASYGSCNTWVATHDQVG